MGTQVAKPCVHGGAWSLNGLFSHSEWMGGANGRVGYGDQHHHHKKPEFTAVSWNMKTFFSYFAFFSFSFTFLLPFLFLFSFIFCCIIQVFMLQTISECYDILELPT